MSTPGTTVRALVAESLRAAALSSADTSPATVLWADPDSTWASAIHSLQEAIPVVVLGTWEGAGSAQGPALWLRALLASPEHVPLPNHLAQRDGEGPSKNPWVVYLPGVHQHELTDLSPLSEHLAPLADLALRSTWWTPPSGQKPWTPHSFLSSKYGARLDLAGDASTRQALQEVLPRLLDENVDALRAQGRLDAARLHARVVPDITRTLLRWMNDQAVGREQATDAEWSAFAHACRSTFGFDPEKDSHLTAAAHLGGREGSWAPVWQRYADSAHRFPAIAQALDQARPQSTLLDEDTHPDSWPSWNREQEDLLRAALSALGDATDTSVARAQIIRLAATHAPRWGTVWAELGHAPLAAAIRVLGELADATASDLTAANVSRAATWYADTGHLADGLALSALTAVAETRDRDAVLTALHAIHDPWLDHNARAFQTLVQVHGYTGTTGLDVSAGTCVVYVDALRLDLAHRLAARLTDHHATIGHRFAAYPTLTPTGQPAVAPVDAEARAEWGPGPGFEAGDAQGRPLKGVVLRGALAASSVQYLDWDDTIAGDVTGVAWTQMNHIDSAGHAPKGAHFETVLDPLLDRIAARITGLLDAGWGRVVVVTDHGFLLPARPAPKVELPLDVTEGGTSRKPRVARLREGATVPDLPAAGWTWAPDVRMVSAPGTAAFEAGVTYDHGGLSPQECIIPVIDVRAKESPIEAAFAAHIGSVRWTGQRCHIDIIPTGAPVLGTVRRHPGDATSSLAVPKAANNNGQIKILVDEDDAAEGTTAYVVLLSDDGAVVAQHQTKVGEDR